MKLVEIKIRILNLQEKHCQKCEYRDNRFQYCNEQCEIGIELNELAERPFKRRKKNIKSQKEVWDEKCEQAIWLFEQGMEYPYIAKEVGCHISSLYRELKKRNLFKAP
ncbi:MULTISPECIES: hypothetical protein [Bacillus cereus group]|uniref:hypothetical protein n=1 Tax=Bacillus cereus group TaxID=86661 RepID=UPI000D9A8953|nr:hypothetical protein [Bacillus cereus]SPT76278.1 Uncharacterised protein [Bacillus cereus]